MNPVADARCALRTVTRTGGQISADGAFPAELAVFSGHFPGRPLVPGVAIIALIQAAYEEAHATSIRIVAIERCTWKRPTIPGERLTLTFTSVDISAISAGAASDEIRQCRINAVVSNAAGIACEAHLVIIDAADH